MLRGEDHVAIQGGEGVLVSLGGGLEQDPVPVDLQAVVWDAGDGVELAILSVDGEGGGLPGGPEAVLLGGGFFSIVAVSVFRPDGAGWGALGNGAVPQVQVDVCQGEILGELVAHVRAGDPGSFPEVVFSVEVE